MTRILSIVSALAVVLVLAPLRSAAAQQPLPDLSLEELMRLDAGRVFGASERLQPVTEAPASVSFITAEEIARYGYRTLADILRGVRGMYVTDDRNFSLLGVRGFGKPGDYNSRVLLLVNGHRVNDNVFGQAEIGNEFGIDPALFERVEIIRGPASSIYGDSAFFAVINVITRSGASLEGASVVLEGGSLDTQLARVTAGHHFASGVDAAVAGTFQQSGGVRQLFYPTFDLPGNNNGIAQGLDGERLGQFYGQLSGKHFTFTTAYGRRQKDVPTASFGTLFNEHQPKEQTTDRHTLVDAEYWQALGIGRLTVRASFDRFSYDGTYPFAGDSDDAVTVGLNSVLGTRWSAGARLTRALPHRQLITLGVEIIDNVHQDQQVRYVDPASSVFDIHHHSWQNAVFVQDEIKLTPWLIANGGLRYDQYEDFQRVTPRAALIATPQSSTQSFKYLYGRAFRAPNEYEKNAAYFGAGTSQLRPESIDTHELVWDRYTNDWLRTAVSAYWYRADGLITLAPDPSTLLGTTYVNEGHVQARGLELEGQMRLNGGLEGFMSYALQRAEDVQTGTALVNSPGQMATFRLSLAAAARRPLLSVEVLTIGSRRTLLGEILKPATTAGVTLSMPLGTAFELTGKAANLFNVQYSDPASDSQRQDTIPQNGRTLRVGVRWKLKPNTR